jgi:hypothetical protein
MPCLVCNVSMWGQAISRKIPRIPICDSCLLVLSEELARVREAEDKQLDLIENSEEVKP